MKFQWVITTGIFAAVFSGVAIGQGTKPHVHGAAELAVVVESEMLEIELHTPLDSLIGFEHAPRSDLQRRAVASMVDKFNKPDILFVPSAAAQCTVQPPKLHSPVLEAPPPSARGSGESGHATLDAVIIFQCKKPELLRHIDVDLFAAFPSVRQLKVQLATSKGQKAVTLGPARKRLAW